MFTKARYSWYQYYDSCSLRITLAVKKQTQPVPHLIYYKSKDLFIAFMNLLFKKAKTFPLKKKKKTENSHINFVQYNFLELLRFCHTHYNGGFSPV